MVPETHLDEEFDNVLVLGESCTGSAGTAHNVVNTSGVEGAFVEVEFKGEQ